MTVLSATQIRAASPGPTSTSTAGTTDDTAGPTSDAGVLLVVGVVVLVLMLAVVLVIGRTATRARQRDRASGSIVGNETVRGEGPAGMSGPAG